MQSIIEIQFFPPIPAMAYLVNSKSIYFENEENYQKRSFRNRCSILSANGMEIISIPLQKGKNEQQKIKDVRISYDQAWGKKIITKLKSAYGKSPFFEHYSDSLFHIFSKKQEYLTELNMDCFLWIFDTIKIQKELTFTKEYQRNYPEETCDLRNVFSPLNREKTNKNNLYNYPQVFEHKFGFIPDLSIIDLIFNTGPESRLILDSIYNKTLEISND